MVCQGYANIDSVIHRLDPRLRLVVALSFAILIALADRWPVLLAALLLAVVLIVMARFPLGALVRRMAAVNLFLLLLVVILPISVPGPAVLELGPLSLSQHGLLQAAMIGTRANAIVLAVTALLSTMELVALGHALHHLKVPDKLVHLMLLCVRYIDVLRHEYLRLIRAMKVRGFRARMNGHTYRTIGYLVGMLLVRSFDRSERIVAAMKCRGFHGRFYMIDHFRLGVCDAAFAMASLVVFGVLTWYQLT